MQIGEITMRTVPSALSIHGADDMRATVRFYSGCVWLSLGSDDSRDGDKEISFFFNGPDALEKAERLAAAINGALHPALKQAAE